MEFETDLDDTGIKEVVWGLYPKGAAIVMQVAVVLILLIVATGAKALGGLVPWIAFVVLAEAILIVSMRKPIKTNIARKHENYPDGKIRYRYHFDDQGIRIENLSNGASVTYQAHDVKRYKETKHYIVLVTKGKQFFAIDRSADPDRKVLSYIKSASPDCKAALKR